MPAQHPWIVDTNVLVRIATFDMPAVAQELVSTIGAMPDASIQLDNAVFAELVFVLTSPKNFGLERTDACRMIKQTILPTKQFACQREVLTLAIETFAATKLDFVDCLVVAQYKLGLVGKIMSLDGPLMEYAQARD